MSLALTHKNPTGVTPIVSDYLEALLCPNYYLPGLWFRSKLSDQCRNPGERREILGIVFEEVIELQARQSCTITVL